MGEGPKQVVHTGIWEEQPEPGNRFAARAAWCHGYDVYGEMLGSARWVEMLYLLFRGEAPSPAEAQLLEMLAVALANPGPRDASVHAAMCGGVGGSPSAACLMAALAVGAGELSGGREIVLAMEAWTDCGTALPAWQRHLSARPPEKASIWPVPGHSAGFDPHGVDASGVVVQSLSKMAAVDCGRQLPWLMANRESLEAAAGRPLALSGVAAAAFGDLGFSPEQGEMLYLLLRLPGAAAHALEQRQRGFKQFPFFAIDLDDAAHGEDA